MPGTTFMDYILAYFVGRVVFWCVGVPLALLFAGYLIGIVVMCVKELWDARERPPRDGSRP